MEHTLPAKSRKTDTGKLAAAALCLALALVLPFLTGQIREIGKMLCPMHLPVLLCGFICGPFYGLAVGAAAPLLRSVLFGMPVMMPHAFCMAFELAAYGLFSGLFLKLFPKKFAWHYAALILAMLCGRAVKGLVSIPLYGLSGTAYTWKLFLAGAFAEAVPGIILQLAVIPPLVRAVKRAENARSRGQALSGTRDQG